MGNYRKDSVVLYHLDRASWTYLNFKSRPSLVWGDPNVVPVCDERNPCV